jgi:hypothetical protein
MGKGNLSTPSYHPAEKKIASCFELLQWVSQPIRVLTSGTWSRKVLYTGTDVSEELSATFLDVE